MEPDIVAMYAQGLSCKDIGKALGLNDETIRQRLIRHGVTLRSRAHKKPKPVPSWEEYFSSKYERAGDCMLWTGHRDKSGYGRLSAVFAPNINFAHRMSWFLANGPFDLDVRVLHRCDTPPCINPNHLFLGNQAENVADMQRKGRQRYARALGENNPSARLTEDQVKMLRDMKHSAKMSQAQMARLLDVSPMTVSRAIRRETWRHIND